MSTSWQSIRRLASGLIGVLLMHIMVLSDFSPVYFR